MAAEGDVGRGAGGEQSHDLGEVGALAVGERLLRHGDARVATLEVLDGLLDGDAGLAGRQLEGGVGELRRGELLRFRRGLRAGESAGGDGGRASGGGEGGQEGAPGGHISRLLSSNSGRMSYPRRSVYGAPRGRASGSHPSPP